MKPIRLSAHAAEQAMHRGAEVREIADAIREDEWEAAANGRSQAKKQFAFDADWNGKHYAHKLVRPIFVVEPDEIVVVTVYVYYYNEEAP